MDEIAPEYDVVVLGTGIHNPHGGVIQFTQLMAYRSD